jgi:hypothetical protein
VLRGVGSRSKGGGGLEVPAFEERVRQAGGAGVKAEAGGAGVKAEPGDGGVKAEPCPHSLILEPYKCPHSTTMYVHTRTIYVSSY